MVDPLGWEYIGEGFVGNSYKHTILQGALDQCYVRREIPAREVLEAYLLLYG